MSNEKPTHFELVKSVKELGERVKFLEDKLNTPMVVSTPIPEIKTVQPGEIIVSSATNYPIPQDYREMVNNILNRSFGIEITPRSDAPLFEFVVIVPEKYSTMTPDQKQMMKRDIRLKVINYAEGANGVRSWCEMIYNSFSQEIKGQITQDRI